MADEKKGNGSGAPEGPDGGEADAQIFDESMAPVIVRAQYLKDLSFESPNAPDSLTEMNADPEINIGVNVEAKKLGEADFEVALLLNVKAEDGGKAIFLVELEYAGIFTLGDVDEEMIQPLILIEAPRLLFPFARNIVADATREGGFPPLMIQPVDFLGLYQQHMEAEGGQGEPVDQA